MSKRLQFKFHLHKTVIILFCIALLVSLMQGVSYFSLNHQNAQSEQLKELARTLTKQVSYSLLPYVGGKDDEQNNQQIQTILQHLTEHSRVLDASVYKLDGSLIAQAGENITVSNRLALDGQRIGSYFTQQIVEKIEGKDGPIGFIRITLDTHSLETESQQVDNTTNMLRIMLLLAVAIGVILTRTLLAHRRSHWKQSPYLLTANSDDADKEVSADSAKKEKKKIGKNKSKNRKRAR